MAALGPRLLRVAGQHAAGTITWMANATAIAQHVAPRIRKAAADAGRPEPRIVVGLPVAVHDDIAEARSVASEQFAIYGTLPNYQRILERGGVAGPADAAIVGDESSVTAQLESLFEAGATDVWAAPFPVGEDRSARGPAPAPSSRSWPTAEPQGSDRSQDAVRPPTNPASRFTRDRLGRLDRHAAAMPTTATGPNRGATAEERVAAGSVRRHPARRWRAGHDDPAVEHAHRLGVRACWAPDAVDDKGPERRVLFRESRW